MNGSSTLDLDNDFAVYQQVGTKESDFPSSKTYGHWILSSNYKARVFQRKCQRGLIN